VTDVKKPLLAVRRLVEKGNTVVLAEGDGESFIQHTASKTRIPVKKKGGSFVIEAHFVAQVGSLGFTRQA
jgi:hydrogenase maturation factor HypE